MAYDIPDDEKEDRGDDHRVKAMEKIAQRRVAVPAGAELLPDIGKGEAPRPGADEGVELEFQLRHAGDAGGQGDEGPHHRQEAAHEDRDAAEAREEAVDQFEVAPADQDVAAPFLDQGPAAVVADGISDGRANVAADRAGGRDEEDIEAPGRDEIAGERHDDFGRQRDAGGFDRHQEGDAEIADRGDDGDDPGRENADNGVEHETRFPSAVMTGSSALAPLRARA